LHRHFQTPVARRRNLRRGASAARRSLALRHRQQRELVRTLRDRSTAATADDAVAHGRCASRTAVCR
jgi:hypothetical protein